MEGHAEGQGHSSDDGIADVSRSTAWRVSMTLMLFAGILTLDPEHIDVKLEQTESIQDWETYQERQEV